jgi:hypothetical protein
VISLPISVALSLREQLAAIEETGELARRIQAASTVKEERFPRGLVTTNHAQENDLPRPDDLDPGRR